MKTKNILKIGVFSIILLSLLISPISKFNSSQVEADDTGGYWGGGSHGTTTWNLYLDVEESDAVKFCRAAVTNWKTLCLSTNEGNTWKCVLMEPFVQAQCVAMRSTIEGLAKSMSGIVNIMVSLILWALNPETFGGIMENSGIQQVWEMCRDCVNVFLILGLIGIAIATILGYKKYAWKQILWKLIVVALLINFSLIIAGSLFDASNFLSGYMLNLVQKNSGNIAPAMLESFGFDGSDEIMTRPDIFDTDEVDKIAAITGADDPKNPLITTNWNINIGQFLIISFIMLLVGIFTLLALIAAFVTILFRTFVIIALLVISPFAFAAWIFPDTIKFWKMWWDNFIKWCTFPIILSFSLYLGIKVMTLMSIDAGSSIQSSIIQMMLFSIFLVGGLIISIQAGGETSQLVMKQASKAGVAIRSFAGRTVTSGVQGSKPYRAIGKKLTQVPLLNKLGYNMLDKSDSTRMIGDIKKREKEIEENRSKDEILNTANGMAPNRMNKKAYTDYMANRNIALKKGWLKNDSKALDSIRTDIRNNNSDLNAKVICDAFPQYFRMKNGKLEEIDQGAPGYSKEVVKNLAGMNAQDLPKHTEHILEAINDAGGDVDEFLQELVSLKTNQLTAFFNNVSEDEYNQGEKVFGGSSTNPRPFQGPNGEIVKRLKAKAADALAAYSNETNSNGTPTAASNLSQSDVDKLEQKWIEADQVLTVLNDKLKTSAPLKETLGTSKV